MATSRSTSARPPSWVGPAKEPTPSSCVAVGYASCFESTLTAVAQRRKDPAEAADAAIDCKVMLVPTPERGFTLAVELAVTLPSVTDPDTAAELVRNAHRVCPYSNATRGNIDVQLTANGAPVELEEPASG